MKYNLDTPKLQFVNNPVPIWDCFVYGDESVVVSVTSNVTWFYRTMTRLFFGWKWKRHDVTQSMRKTSLREACSRHGLTYSIDQNTKDEMDLKTGKIQSEEK